MSGHSRLRRRKTPGRGRLEPLRHSARSAPCRPRPLQSTRPSYRRPACTRGRTRSTVAEASRNGVCDRHRDAFFWYRCCALKRKTVLGMYTHAVDVARDHRAHPCDLLLRHNDSRWCTNKFLHRVGQSNCQCSHHGRRRRHVGVKHRIRRTPHCLRHVTPDSRSHRSQT